MGGDPADTQMTRCDHPLCREPASGTHTLQVVVTTPKRTYHDTLTFCGPGHLEDARIAYARGNRGPGLRERSEKTD
jgi:hypothetical protein